MWFELEIWNHSNANGGIRGGNEHWLDLGSLGFSGSL